MGLHDIAKALNLKSSHKKDIGYIVIGMIIAFILCGIIIAVMMLCSKSITIGSLSGVSPIRVFPLYGNKLWFTLFLPVFFFNWRRNFMERLYSTQTDACRVWEIRSCDKRLDSLCLSFCLWLGAVGVPDDDFNAICCF